MLTMLGRCLYIPKTLRRLWKTDVRYESIFLKVAEDIQNFYETGLIQNSTK